ncbi:putative pollen-specific leucine-rich repeat extensin-like protein 3 [Iris pallida]|uniref:Pollen-specific leucine-rich repeat extensin-like protein 3 n=1 Tax=Iris pallida TaxID=29817 RepID=A0AAX6GM17_IRIPA|nr:putative pollen-specific leucine-rich repeat extensin-like protein 3 [Iris pallida]
MLSSPSLLSFITHSQYNHATSIALANPTPNSFSSSLDRPTLLWPRRRRPSPSPPPSPSSSSNTSSSLSPPLLSDHNRHGRAPMAATTTSPGRAPPDQAQPHGAASP